jgi:hypothetical protein
MQAETDLSEIGGFCQAASQNASAGQCAVFRFTKELRIMA